MIAQQYDTEIRILIAEDSQSVSSLLQMICLSLGYQADIAENGAIAMEMMAHATYDIFIVDLVMPLVSGKELISHIKEKAKESLILVESAADNPETIIDIMRMGIFDYLLKPLETDVINDVISKAAKFYISSKFHKNFDRSLKDEIAVIRDIQSSMLPDVRKVIPEFDIYLSMIPAIELSGDFYDIIEVKPQVYDIILCDVAGHGLASAYMGAQFKSIFQYLSKKHQQVDALVYDMNNYITTTFNTSCQYSTAVICRVDNRRGIIQYVSAGHPSGWLWDESEKKISHLDSTGPLLGAFESATYIAKTISLDKGDTMVFVTDGLADMMNIATRERFGYERLDATMTDVLGNHSDHIVLETLARCYEFSDHVGQPDDITIISIRKK